MIKFSETFGVTISSASLTDSSARSSCGDLLGCDPPRGIASKHPDTLNARKNGYRALPGFCDVPRSEKQALFGKKLDLCCVVFDFAEPAKDAKKKKIKRQTLEELVEHIETSTKNFLEVVLENCMKMVSVNLFRVLDYAHKRRLPEIFDCEYEEPYMDPSWPHLELVYQFLLTILKSRALDTKTAVKFVDDRFILRLLDLFDSEDPRERESLKAILHRIYSKFTKHRPFIKKVIENILYRFIYETGKHNGVAELLEVLGSIITGFILPLKEEHKVFLVKVLIPLHKMSSMKMFHEQLCYCIMQFIEKDARLAGTVIRGLLKYWPVTNSSKQVIFLRELEEVLEATTFVQFDSCAIPLSLQIARCLDNLHFQVAERVSSLWKNYHIERMMAENMGVVLPILYPSLERNAREHWNKGIQKQTQNALEIFSNHNKKLFQECVQRLREEKAKEEQAKFSRKATWERLEEIAASRASLSEVLASQPVY